jgi:hypothetical protein
MGVSSSRVTSALFIVYVVYVVYVVRVNIAGGWTQGKALRCSESRRFRGI